MEEYEDQDWTDEQLELLGARCDAAGLHAATILKLVSRWGCGAFDVLLWYVDQWEADHGGGGGGGGGEGAGGTAPPAPAAAAGRPGIQDAGPGTSPPPPPASRRRGPQRP